MAVYQLYFNPAEHQYSAFSRRPAGKGYINTSCASLDVLVNILKEDTKGKKPIFIAEVPNIDWGNYDERQLMPMPEAKVREILSKLGLPV